MNEPVSKPSEEVGELKLFIWEIWWMGVIFYCLSFVVFVVVVVTRCMFTWQKQWIVDAHTYTKLITNDSFVIVFVINNFVLVKITFDLNRKTIPHGIEFSKLGSGDCKLDSNASSMMRNNKCVRYIHQIKKKKKRQKIWIMMTMANATPISTTNTTGTHKKRKCTIYLILIQWAYSTVRIQIRTVEAFGRTTPHIRTPLTHKEC